jgi:hypothetical protein
MDIGDFAIALPAYLTGNIAELANGSADGRLGDRLCCHRSRGRFRVITSEGQGDEGRIVYPPTRWSIRPASRGSRSGYAKPTPKPTPGISRPTCLTTTYRAASRSTSSTFLTRPPRMSSTAPRCCNGPCKCKGRVKKARAEEPCHARWRTRLRRVFQGATSMACPSRLGDTGDVSNDGKEFKGIKEFELLRRREEQILHRLSVHMQVGGHRLFETGRGAIP